MKPPSDAALDKEYDANKLEVPQDLRNAMKAAANVLTDTASMHKYLKSLDDAMLKIYVDLLQKVDASASSSKAASQASSVGRGKPADAM